MPQLPAPWRCVESVGNRDQRSQAQPAPTWHRLVRLMHEFPQALPFVQSLQHALGSGVLRSGAVLLSRRYCEPIPPPAPSNRATRAIRPKAFTLSDASGIKIGHVAGYTTCDLTTDYH
jgi:hypothetical protein